MSKLATQKAIVRVRAHALKDDGASRAAGKGRLVKGARLVNLVRKKAAEKGMTERQIADEFSISPIYWNSLTNGNRLIGSLPRETMEKVAEFVEMPLVQAYVLAGQFEPKDFVVKVRLESQLMASIEKMRADQRWATLAPTDSDWASTALNVKVALVALYESVSQTELLDSVKVVDPALRI